MKKAVFRVFYGCVWDGAIEDVDIDADSSTVAAPSAEAAITAVRKNEIGNKVPKPDDDGKEMPGKFIKVTDIVVKSVEFVSSIDLIAK